MYFNFTFSNLENHEIGLRRIEGEYANFETTLDDSKPASLPLNMFYTTWGDTQYTNDGKLEIVNLYFSDNPNEKILVTHLNRDSNLLEIFSDSSKQAQVFLTDKITSHDTKEFVRKIYNRSYHIKDNKVFFIFDLINPQKFITASNPVKTKPANAMTMDTETYTDSKGVMHIYLISFFDGSETICYYLSDFKNIDEMLSRFLKKVFLILYNNKVLYIHNSSSFDLIFLL